MTTDIQLAYLDLSPKLDVVLSKCFDDNELLIRGDLASVRENASSELKSRNQNVDQEEIAFDVRPNKVQPRNEIVNRKYTFSFFCFIFLFFNDCFVVHLQENYQNESHQMITLTVLDVKSVKRVRKLQVNEMFLLFLHNYSVMLSCVQSDQVLCCSILVNCQLK